MNKKENLYSVGEEILNSVSHGVTALLAVAFSIVLLVVTINLNQNSLAIFSIYIYGICLSILYTASTLYHALSRTKASEVFQRLDHISIYLLIAGTYTPVSLLVIQNIEGWILFGIVWLIAIIGIVFKSIFGAKYDYLSTFLYLIMGWLIVFFAKTFYLNLNLKEFSLFVLGGLFYSIGTYFYLKGDSKKWHHGIWHFFVSLGSISHYLAIFSIII